MKDVNLSIEATCSENMIKLALEPIYDEFVYDGSPDLREYKPEGIWFLLLSNRSLAGIINLQKINNTLWMPHIYIYEHYRGKGSEEWGKQVLEQMGPNQKYLALTPYKSAKKYAEKLGFKLTGKLTKSIKKDGKLMDQYMLEYGGDKK